MQSTFSRKPTAALLHACLWTALLGASACSNDQPAQQTPACIVHSQCLRGECRGGACVNATPCGDDNQCERGTKCVEERCLPVCGNDTECPSGYVCTMESCKAFSDTVNVPTPVDRAGVKTPLRAGVAEANLDVPVGVSLGGFAGRGGLYNDDYAESIFPSTGFFHRLRVKALALDTGNERVVLLTAPMIFITDFLRDRVVRILKQKLQKDYREHLIITANHTHSGPARFWTLPRGFGAFGVDEHMPEIHERVAQSMAQAISDAVGRLATAKMGWTVDTAWDMDSKITSSRRRPSPHGKDNRMFLMRVDDDAGNPLAAVLNFGMHGIIHEGPYQSSDSGGGAEFKTEEALEAKHGRRVPVLFVQENGGNMSPRADDTDLPDIPRAELIGIRTAPYVMAKWDTIVRKADWDMRFGLKRIPISRALIGYGPTEFYDENPIGGYKPYTYGAFECVLSLVNNQPAVDGNIGCVLPIESTFHAPIQTFTKTVFSMWKLDDLLISTHPGEPVMEYGYTVRTGLLAVPGVREAQIFGYSQDHQLYLLHADEWYYGGVEGNTTIWGPKFGDYLSREAITYGGEFWSGAKVVSKVLPQDFFFKDAPADIVPDTTAAADVGTMVVDVPATHERDAQLRITVVGGHPGAGSPDIILQREIGGTFTDLASDGTPHQMGRTRYDNTTYKFVTDHDRVRPGVHQWSFRWEELRGFALGRYRFRLALPYWNGTAKLTKEANSSAFQLVPSSRLIVTTASVSAAGVSVMALGPTGIQSLQPRERFERGAAVDLDCDGTPDVTMDVTQDYESSGIRVRDPAVGPVDPLRITGNIKVTVTKDGGTPQVFENVVPGNDNTAATTTVKVGRGPVTASTSRPELIGQQVDRVRCVTMRAPAWSVTSGFTFGGAGSYAVRVEDSLGNYGTKTVVVP